MALEEFEKEELNDRDKRLSPHAQHHGLWYGTALDGNGCIHDLY